MSQAELVSEMKRRLNLLRRLSGSLLRSRDAIVHLNLDALLEATAEQNSLCRELHDQQAGIKIRYAEGKVVAGKDGAAPVLSLTLTASEPEESAAWARELAEAQEEVRTAARINGMLLQRCSRTTACLRNFWLRYSETYANPRAAWAAGAERR